MTNHQVIDRGTTDEPRIGKYVICEDCHEPISQVRMAAVPGTRWCRACAQRREDLLAG